MKKETRDEVKAKLQKQWPKYCGCRKSYKDPETWERLPFAYMYTDNFATQEARHCSCGSTIVVLVDIHSLDEE